MAFWAVMSLAMASKELWCVSLWLHGSFEGGTVVSPELASKELWRVSLRVQSFFEGGGWLFRNLGAAASGVMSPLSTRRLHFLLCLFASSFDIFCSFGGVAVPGLWGLPFLMYPLPFSMSFDIAGLASTSSSSLFSCRPCGAWCQKVRHHWGVLEAAIQRQLSQREKQPLGNQKGISPKGGATYSLQGEHHRGIGRCHLIALGDTI